MTKEFNQKTSAINATKSGKHRMPTTSSKNTNSLPTGITAKEAKALKSMVFPEAEIATEL